MIMFPVARSCLVSLTSHYASQTGGLRPLHGPGVGGGERDGWDRVAPLRGSRLRREDGWGIRLGVGGGNAVKRINEDLTR